MDTQSLAVNNGTVSFRGERGAAALVYAGSESEVSPAAGRAADPIAVMERALLPPSPAGMDALIPTVTPEAGTSTGTSAGTATAAPFGLGFQFSP
jgi:hypothetical protein